MLSSLLDFTYLLPAFSVAYTLTNFQQRRTTHLLVNTFLSANAVPAATATAAATAATAVR